MQSIRCGGLALVRWARSDGWHVPCEQREICAEIGLRASSLKQSIRAAGLETSGQRLWNALRCRQKWWEPLQDPVMLGELRASKGLQQFLTQFVTLSSNWLQFSPGWSRCGGSDQADFNLMNLVLDLLQIPQLQRSVCSLWNSFGRITYFAMKYNPQILSSLEVNTSLSCNL